MVVPSSGSSAISIFGPVPGAPPTFSPMNSIGASSRSPSPITTVPSMSSSSNALRMASTAAASAAFSSPRPTSLLAATAAASVTRTISSTRTRSSTWLGETAAVFMANSVLCESVAPRLGGRLLDVELAVVCRRRFDGLASAFRGHSYRACARGLSDRTAEARVVLSRGTGQRDRRLRQDRLSRRNTVCHPTAISAS